jgi:hypothetical protein
MQARIGELFDSILTFAMSLSGISVVVAIVAGA